MRTANITTDQLDKALTHGMAILSLGASPMSGGNTSHRFIVSNPFNIQFNANESVSLNTGASIFRTNILTLQGRNGFDLNLDLVYNSSQAELLTRSMGMWSSHTIGRRTNGFGLPTGWLYDLPYIADNALHLPGRGMFNIDPSGNIIDYPRNDMQLEWYWGFNNGHMLQSNQRLRFHNGTRYYFNNGRIIGMADRFGNTIRFEYTMQPQFGNHMLLSRIVSTYGQESVVNFTYTVFGNNRMITITSPDGSTYHINMSYIFGYSWGEGNLQHRHFWLQNVVNQVGAITSFNYEMRHLFYCFICMGSCGCAYPIPTMLLTQVNYPSQANNPHGAALSFSYDTTVGMMALNSMGFAAIRQVARVRSRGLSYD